MSKSYIHLWFRWNFLIMLIRFNYILLYYLSSNDISVISRKTYLDLISSWSNFDAAIEIDCIYSHHRIQHQQTSKQTRLYKIAISKYFATFLRGRWYGWYNCCRYTAASKIMLRTSLGCPFCVLIFHLFTQRKLHKTHSIINVLGYHWIITYNTTMYYENINYIWNYEYSTLIISYKFKSKLHENIAWNDIEI